MKNKVDFSLYLVTDRSLMSTSTLEDGVEAALKGGCTMVQLREKDISSLLFYETALKIREITHRYHVPLIINDRVDIALSVEADGVHLGQSDLPAPLARHILGPKKLLGVSVSSVQEALKAWEEGADYLGVGAMFPTLTKKNATAVSFEALSAIRQAVSIPIVVIGGINADTSPAFSQCNIDGLAVVSAILSKKDITGAACHLLEIFKGFKNRI